MKRQEKQKKLKLHRETIRTLAQDELDKILGGANMYSVVYTCWETVVECCRF